MIFFSFNRFILLKTPTVLQFFLLYSHSTLFLLTAGFLRTRRLFCLFLKKSEITVRILCLMTAVFVFCPRQRLAALRNYSDMFLNGHASKDIIVYKSLEIKIMSQMINSSADPTCQLKKMTHLYAIGAHDKTKVMLKSVI